MPLVNILDMGREEPTREQFEQAARFAGVTIDKSEFNGGGKGNDGFCFNIPVRDWHKNLMWTPHLPSEDAFVLLCKVGSWAESFAFASEHQHVRDEFRAYESAAIQGDPNQVALSTTLLAAAVQAARESKA